MTRFSAVVVCLVLIWAATGLASAQDAGSELYDSAVEFAVAGNWETALWVFDRVRSESADQELRAKALAWSTIIRMGMESANRSLALRLEKAIERGLATEQARLSSDAALYRATAERWHREWTADMRELLATAGERWIEIDIPAGYSLRIPPERAHVESSLQYGLYPGSLSLLVYREFLVSIMIPITFEHPTYVGIADEIASGKSVRLRLDLAKLYLHAATICTAAESDLQQTCLERVLELTSGEPYSKTRLEAEKLLRE